MLGHLMKPHTRWLGVAAGFLACLLASPTASAQGASTIIVLDGSNSMNGRLAGDKDPKHVMVREALRKALPRIAPATRVGLASFGHRRPSDCTDADVILPPAPDAGRILAAIEKQKPQGFSPVALAMRAAAKAFPPADVKTSLVILIDDLASCKAEDPCVVAQELKKANPALTVHVVGLGLKPPDAPTLSCVAERTGGRFFDAQDGQAAATAIEQVLALVNADATLPVPPAPKAAQRPPAKATAAAPAPPPRDTRPGLALSARLSEGGGVLALPVRWKVAGEGGRSDAAPLAEITGPYLNLPLPPGRYVVDATAGLVSQGKVVEVTAAGPTVQAFVLDAGTVTLTAPLQKGGASSDRAVISLSQTASGGAAAKPVWIGRGGAEDLVVPAGSYRILAEDGIVRADRVVTVQAGSRSEIELSLEAARLALEVAGAPGPVAGAAVFLVEEDDPDSPGGRREVTRSAVQRPQLTLPAGMYTVTARRGDADVRERILLKAGEEVVRTLALQSARVTLATRLVSAPAAAAPDLVSYRIERLDLPGRVITRTGVAEPTLEISPGRYRIEARIGAQNAVATGEVEVRAGSVQRVEVAPQAGTIRLRLAGGVGGLGLGEVFWHVLDGSGRVVWRTVQAEPRLLLAAGRYTVRVELRDRVMERTFDIKAGESRALEVSG